MAVETVQELFEYELNEVYSAERAMGPVLHALADGATLWELRHAYDVHRQQTENQIARLDGIFQAIDRTPLDRPSAGVQGLVAERDRFLQTGPSNELMEVFDLGVAQKIERYEITAYEALIDIAERLGAYEAAELLEETLHEEEGALRKMQFLASDYDMSRLPAEDGTRPASSQRER